MSEFQFKEIDKEGEEILDVISKADKFNHWMYQTIKPYCSGKILEIGSGIGNISQFFITEKSEITLSDIRENYCGRLRDRFPDAKEVIQLNLTHPNFETEYAKYIGQFDAVFALNVVEHIEDDVLAIKNCYRLLKPSGKLTILVPAYQALYNKFDVELEHFRRYSKKKLTNTLTAGGFEVVHSQYFNFVGIAGWFVSGKLQKNKTIPEGQMSLYNKLVPLFKIVDKLQFNLMGLSVICVGVKK